MGDNHFDDIELEIGAFSPVLEELVPEEVTLSAKSARRRKIEDLFEERRLKDELDEFG